MPNEAGQLMEVTEAWYLVLGAIVFSIGAVGLMVRRNPLVMFMCVELMLNATNLTFITFANALNDVGGQAIVFFVLVVAAAEVVVGLGIIVALLRRKPGATANPMDAHRVWLTGCLTCSSLLQQASVSQPLRGGWASAETQYDALSVPLWRQA